MVCFGYISVNTLHKRNDYDDDDDDDDNNNNNNNDKHNSNNSSSRNNNNGDDDDDNNNNNNNNNASGLLYPTAWPFLGLRMEKTATDNQLATNWLNVQSWATDGQRIHMLTLTFSVLLNI